MAEWVSISQAHCCRLSLGETPPAQPDGRADVVTRLGLDGIVRCRAAE